MRNLKEQFINGLLYNGNICPAHLGLKELHFFECNNINCRDCWRYALENIEIVEKGE